jgi:PAS domain S-box-containing protein
LSAAGLVRKNWRPDEPEQRRLVEAGNRLTGSSPAATRRARRAAGPGRREIVAKQLILPQNLANALLAAIVESSDDAIASKTLDGIVTSWNRAAEHLFGYAAEEMIGRPIAVLAAPGRENEMPAILERIRRGERVDHFDTVRRRKDGTLVEVSLSVSPVHDEAGRIVGASKVARDITERRRAEQERDLRLGELRHRVKNLLAMVQALAHRTGTEGRSGEQYRDTFLGRLEALVVAHELAFAVEDGADLATIVGRTLEPYAGEHAAVTVAAGPAVTLAGAKVQALALVLHELATNAVKHGALSKPEGRVWVGWKVEKADGIRRLRLRWEERGGPRVEPPAVRGFGTRLIQHAAAGELGGPAELAFAPEGLEAEITVLIG